MTTREQFHWFWAWDDEKEEAWLREMSQKGWHLKSVSFPGSYIFEQGEPIDYVYRLDYFTNRKDMAGYLQIFEDAHWDYMGEMNGWQYFRQQAIAGEAPEIYSDNESKVKKYQRILMFLVILFPVFFSPIMVISRGPANNGIIQVITMVITIVIGVALLLYVYGMARLLLRITQLKKKF
ncbi:MAG: DUF2812 domain-containing protein [Chloroflexi bacterium]|nr:DUF2812 domain-containing protein [Chloroflexota bacterium]